MCCSPIPRGFCAGVDRAIAIVEQALAQFGAPIYVRHEVVHNTLRRRRPEAQGRRVRRGARRDSRRRTIVIFSAHGVAKAVRGEADARGLTRVRRHLPARDQGTRRDRKNARAGPRDRDDRPCRAPRGRRARWGNATAACTSSNRSMMSRACAVKDPVAPRLRHADHAVGRRCGVGRRRAASALSRDRRAEEGRHLLCDTKPAGRGEVHESAGRRGDRRRQPEQLEFQPPARSRVESRRAVVHGRQCRANCGPNGSRASGASASPQVHRRRNCS